MSIVIATAQSNGFCNDGNQQNICVQSAKQLPIGGLLSATQGMNTMSRGTNRKVHGLKDRRTAAAAPVRSARRQCRVSSKSSALHSHTHGPMRNDQPMVLFLTLRFSQDWAFMTVGRLAVAVGRTSWHERVRRLQVNAGDPQP